MKHVRQTLLALLTLSFPLAASAESASVARTEPGSLAITWQVEPGDQPTRHRVAVSPGATFDVTSLEDATGAAVRASATIEPGGFAGRVAYVELRLDPAGLHPGSYQVVLTERPAATPSAEALPPALASTPEILASAGVLSAEPMPPGFINAEDARRMRRVAPIEGRVARADEAPSAFGRVTRQRVAAGQAAPKAMGGGRVKFLVAPDEPGRPGGAGLYRITHAMLVAAGLDPTGTQLADLRLRTMKGDQTLTVVRIRVHDEDGDGTFGSADWLEFFGEPLLDEDVALEFQRADWADVRGYVLDVAPGTPSGRIDAARDATPMSPLSPDRLTTAHAEKNDLFLHATRTMNYGVDHFYWCSTQSMTWQTGLPEQDRTETVALPGLLPGSARRGSVHVRLLSRTLDAPAQSPDHRSIIDVNGRPGLSDISGEGFQVVDHVISGLSPATDLSADTSVTIRVPPFVRVPPIMDDQNRFDLDYIEITYPTSFTPANGRLVFTHEPGFRVAVPGLASAAVDVLDVTDPWNPVVLQNVALAAGTASFEVAGAAPLRLLVQERPAAQPTLVPSAIEVLPPARLSSPSNAADVVVVGPRAYLEAQPPIGGLERWLAKRRAEGLRVMTVTTEDAVDEFTYGTLSPFSVGQMLVTAWASWAEPPDYVLFVGDAAIDTKNQLDGRILDPATCGDAPDPCGFDETGYVLDVPTRMFEQPADTQFLGYYASDSIYSCVRGFDYTPDLALGRLPGRSAAEVGALFDKVLAYEELGASPPPWASRVFLVADDISSIEPQEQAFETFQQDVADASLHPYYDVREFFYDRDYGGSQQARFTQDLLAAWADPDESAAVLSYVGHGSAFRWSAQSLLTNRLTGPCRNDVETLAGSEPTPFIINANCITGTFVYPLGPSLLEELVREPVGGAIAAFGPTGVTELSEAETVLQAAYGGIHGQSGRGGRIGEAIRGIQGALAFGDLTPFLSNAFLGDPTMKLIVPFGPAAIGLDAEAADLAVNLTWPAVPGAVTYNLYRSDTGENGPFELLASGLSGTSMTDSGDPPGVLGPLVNNTLYFYALEPIDARPLPGRWSDLASARPCALAAPPGASNLRVTPGPCTGSFTVRWDASPSPDLQSYVLRVYIGDQVAGAPLRTTYPPGTFTTVGGLIPHQIYSFVVTPRSWCFVEGPPTNVVSVASSCPLVIDPPAYIPDLRVTREGTNVVLEWQPVTETVLGTPASIVGHEVHRLVDAADLPGAATLIDAPPAPGTMDVGRIGSGLGVDYYVVAALDASGRLGPLGHDYPQGVRFPTESAENPDCRLTWMPPQYDIRGELTRVDAYLVYTSTTPIDRARAESDASLTRVRVTSPTYLIPGSCAASYAFVVPEDLHGNLSVN